MNGVTHFTSHDPVRLTASISSDEMRWDDIRRDEMSDRNAAAAGRAVYTPPCYMQYRDITTTCWWWAAALVFCPIYLVVNHIHSISTHAACIASRLCDFSITLAKQQQQQQQQLQCMLADWICYYGEWPGRPHGTKLVYTRVSANLLSYSFLRLRPMCIYATCFVRILLSASL